MRQLRMYGWVVALCVWCVGCPERKVPPRKAPAPARPKARATTGVLVVTSIPPQARVLIDGKDRGLTQLSVPLSVGEHTLSLQKDGYTTWSRKVTITAGKTLIKAAQLELFKPEPRARASKRRRKPRRVRRRRRSRRGKARRRPLRRAKAPSGPTRLQKRLREIRRWKRRHRFYKSSRKAAFQKLYKAAQSSDGKSANQAMDAIDKMRGQLKKDPRWVVRNRFDWLKSRFYKKRKSMAKADASKVEQLLFQSTLALAQNNHKKMHRLLDQVERLLKG